MIKKIALFLLSLLLLFTFTGCGADENHESSSTSQATPENTYIDKETERIEDQQDMAASSDADEVVSRQGVDQDKEDGLAMGSKESLNCGCIVIRYKIKIVGMYEREI